MTDYSCMLLSDYTHYVQQVIQSRGQSACVMKCTSLFIVHTLQTICAVCRLDNKCHRDLDGQAATSAIGL